jgi:putative LysE/RhtB family amino acid efflux pump
MTLLWITFATGFGLGLAIAMPVGPISLLCIQQALTRGFGAGVAAGLGVALADASYGAVAAFGLTAITNELVNLQVPLRVLGVLAMLWLAWRIWRDADAPKHLAPGARSGAATTAQLFVLTIANPMTILTFLALFVGAGVGLTASYAYSAALTLGVFAGSLLWWVALSGIVGILRARINDQTLRWINRASALMIGGFALWIAAGLLGTWT